MRWLKRWRKRLRTLIRRDAVERELDEELAYHLELETRKYEREGMTRAAAERRAALAFGGIEKHKEQVRDARVLGWLPGASLDFRLGVRMLARSPGLSLVAVVGMAVAIGIGAGFFSFISAMLDSTMPVPEGERIVAIRNWDVRQGRWAGAGPHDLFAWTDELQTVQELGAYRTIHRNLIDADGSVELVEAAEMTPAGFQLWRVAPLRGRPLVAADGRPGADRVLIIAYEEWQRRFEGDAAIIGRTVRLGAVPHTIVGVMPAGTEFPFDYSYWTALQLGASGHDPGSGPFLEVFGRLADGVDLRRARAELEMVGSRAARAWPHTHAHLRPTVLPYTQAALGIDTPTGAYEVYLVVYLAISLLLVVVAANVAVLVYARTAKRMGEIVVRTALGASRRRVATQLFVEALVLSFTAAAIGLGLTSIGLRLLNNLLAGNEFGLPSWLHLGLSPRVVLHAVALAVLAAVIVGVAPALQATGRSVQVKLRQLSSGGSQLQLGRTWTVLIVAQVAIAVALLPVAIHFATRSFDYAHEPDYPADELLHARVSIALDDAPLGDAMDDAPLGDADSGDTAARTRLERSAEELVRRLGTEPAVAAVTVAARFPGRESAVVAMELDGGAGPPALADGEALIAGGQHWVRVNDVGNDLFEVFGVPILAGRGFHESDTGPGANAVVVNEVFAQRLAAGSDVIGRRVRAIRTDEAGNPQPGPWHEIVGVVPDFAATSSSPEATAKLYRPARPGRDMPTVIVRVRGMPAAQFARRISTVAAAVDPSLVLHDVRSASEVLRQDRRAFWYISLLVGGVIMSVLLLSAAGIYALMSFTVGQRRREIGIRTALGAQPRQIAGAIFSKATGQLPLGVAGGLLLIVLLDSVEPELLKDNAVVLLPLVTALIAGIGLLAAVGPARRALRVPPLEALKE